MHLIHELLYVEKKNICNAEQIKLMTSEKKNLIITSIIKITELQWKTFVQTIILKLAKFTSLSQFTSGHHKNSLLPASKFKYM